MTDQPQAVARPRARTLAEKLELALEAGPPNTPAGTFTGKDLVKAVRQRGGELSESHFSELRRGIKTNPTIQVLQSIAEVLEFRVGFFVDEKVAEEVEAELDLRIAMRDAQVQDIAHRAAGLDPTRLAALNRILAQTIREHTDQA
jgi:transcriptional regulator with XRE-family HTH domain